MLQATPSNPTAAAQIKADGHADVKGSDWGVGYQLAWMWDINDRARVGVNYRSKVSHTLKGDAEWAADGAAAKQQWNDNMLTPLGYTANEKARVKIVTPESLSVHGMYKVSDKADLFGDVTWTRHSRFNKAELFFEKEKNIANGKKSDRTTITPNWRNTYKVGLGGSYQISEPLQLRVGIAFDKPPVRNADYRMNSLPDGNRIWFSAGMKYRQKPRRRCRLHPHPHQRHQLPHGEGKRQRCGQQRCVLRTFQKPRRHHRPAIHLQIQINVTPFEYKNAV